MPFAAAEGFPPPPHSSVSLLRSLVNMSKLPSDDLRSKQSPTMPCLTWQESFPNSRQFPADMNPPLLSPALWVAGAADDDDPQVLSPCQGPLRTPWSSRTAPRAQHRWSTCLILPSLPHSTPGIKPWPSANYTRPCRPPLGVQRRGRVGRGGRGTGWGRPGLQPRRVPTLDFI